jgi:hypothetical protein
MQHEDLVEYVRKFGQKLEKLKDKLDTLGYAFERPDEVLPGPHADTERILARIEENAGSVPPCIAVLHREIGSVDFCGHHPAWHGCQYPDPIVVLPLESAECELDIFIEDGDEYRDGTYRIPIAPDYYHKADVSGGDFYGIAVPDNRLDVPLLEEPHDTTLLGYLEIVLKWGGFPGLESVEGTHSWPIKDLIDACNGA